MINIYTELWNHLPNVRKRQFFLLLVLMVFASFAEALSIGSVLPFLGILSNPSYLLSMPIFGSILDYTAITSGMQPLLLLTIIFCIATVFASGLRLFLLWVCTKFSFVTGLDLSVDIYKKTLYQPYAVHTSRNSSEILNGVYSKSADLVYLLIMPTLNILTSTIILVAVLASLLYINTVFALTALMGFTLIYGAVMLLTHKKLVLNSLVMSKEADLVIKNLQEGLGGIRDVLLDNTQEMYSKQYSITLERLRNAQASNAFIGGSPRYIAEGLAIVFISSLAYVYTSSSLGLMGAIPLLGVLALGAQRLLPIAQQLYGSWSLIIGGQSSVLDALKLLDQPISSIYKGQSLSEDINFRERIFLKKVSYSHISGGSEVLKDLVLSIKKGELIGVIGKTGCGKSTLLDLIMGLLTPSSGQILIDDVRIDSANLRSWQSKVAHVPQEIYLSDSTIKENIAFGVNPDCIDMKLVIKAAYAADIAQTIEDLPEGFETLVGERGVRLSGGQRQRIGIARALYKKAEVLILDEATSALDSETELNIMRSIVQLSKQMTIIIVAHRLTTLKCCNRVLVLEDSAIKQIGTYEEVCSRSGQEIKTGKGND